MYTFLPLDSSSFNTFAAFIPPQIKVKLDSLDPDFKVIALGTTNQNTPVGACFALLNDNLHYLEILHIEVSPQHRNQHIGTTLIGEVQKEALKQGAKIFSFIYTQDTPETPIIEKILKNNHWQGTRPFLIRCNFDALTFDTEWVHANFRYPKGFKEFSWKYLNEKDRVELNRKQHQGHFPAIISPFKEEKNIEPMNSLGLRYEGHVVGWLITHRMDQDTIRYSSLFIERPFHFHGIAMKLLASSILRHLQARTKYAYLEVPLIQVHPSWVRFIEKRIVPHATSVVRLKQYWHTAF